MFKRLMLLPLVRVCGGEGSNKMWFNESRRWTAIFALVTLCTASFAQSSDTVTAAYLQGQVSVAPDAVTALGPDLFGDKLNLFNGSLEFEQTEVSLPGNNALPVALVRQHTPGRSWQVRGAMADWDLNTPRIQGTFANPEGWRPEWGNATGRCTQFSAPPAVTRGSMNALADFQPWEYWQGTHLVIPGQGSQEILRRAASYAAQPADGQSYPLVTRANWQIRCLPALQNDGGEGFVAVSPEGVTYRFDWMASRYQPGLRKGDAAMGRRDMFLMATQVTDRFGNWVAYTYDAGNPLNLQRIESSDGRLITLTYAGGRVAFVTDQTRTWQYIYDGNGDLQTVLRPDGSKWQFNLRPMVYTDTYLLGEWVDCDSMADSAPGVYTGTMTHPSGAVGTFETMFLPHGRSGVQRACTYVTGSTWTNGSMWPRSTANQALTSKTITGPGMSPMTWTYGDGGDPHGQWAPCDPCTDRKVVTVTEPNGAVTRHTFGILWRVNEGQLLKTEEGWDGNTALRTTTFTYRTADGQAYPDRFGDSVLFSSDYLSYRNRPMDTKVINQQGVDFTWQVNAGAGGFDGFARPVQVNRFSSLGHALSETSTYADHNGKWVLGQLAGVLSAGLLKEQTSFDSNSALPTARYSFGRLVESFSYYGDGTVYQRLDPLGRATTFGDYYRGVPRSINWRDGNAQSAQVNNIGRITSYTNAAGTTTTYGYDAMGRLASINYPAEAWGSYFPTSVTFEQVNQDEWGIPAGHWRQTVTTGNARTMRFFDAMWRVGLTQTWDMGSPGSTSSYVIQRYDADGRKTFESRPQRTIGSIGDNVPGKTWFYDKLGRTVAQSQDSEIGTLNTVTEYLNGFQRRITNARGYATTTAFQAFDTPGEDAPAAIWAPEGVSVSIARDSFGKATAITRGGAWGGSGPASVTRSLYYDSYQRLCKTVEPESGATVQAYDGAGNLAWRASGLNLPGSGCDQGSVPGGRIISYGYDAMDRLISTNYGDGSQSITRSYTADGLLSRIFAAEANNPITWNYTYNNRRMLASEQYAWWPGSGANDGWLFSYGIDAYGHVNQLTDPWGAIDYAPDALGQPTQVWPYAYGVSYHPGGEVAGYTLTNGITHTVTLNTRGLPQWWQYGGVSNDQYAYDADGNVSAITDYQQGGLNSRSMGYDGLERLTQANGPWGAGNYAYDALDNLRRSTVGSRDLWHNYDDNNRLASVTGTQTLGFGYDANGNITSRGGQGFSFDIGNRLVTAPGQVNSTVYDGHGRRNLVWFSSGQYMHQAYTRDGKLRLAWRPDEGGTRHVYLGDKHIAETVESGVTTFTHTDALGSPIAVTGSSGQLVSRTQYEPYGATVGGSTNPTKIGFTGHVNDPGTGLVYMQQRYYEPIAGRFLSVDPVVSNANTGGNFNRYAYVENNPYANSDPDGTTCQKLNDGNTQCSEPVTGSNIGVRITVAPGGSVTAVSGSVGSANAGSALFRAAQSFMSSPAGVALALALTPSNAGQQVRDQLTGPYAAAAISDQNVYAKPPENARDPNGPKAPGKPPEELGFRDPKGGENWVPNPNPGRGGGTHGWQDSNGDVWVPSGHGGRAHGGPHWDVQTPGGGYRNVRPPRP